MSPTTTARFLLTLGVAFVFLYFGIDKFVHPLIWTGWMPTWIDGLANLDKDVWLQIIGVTEVTIGLLVLVPVRIVQKAGVLLATLHLSGVLTQTGWNAVAVRDIGLVFMTTALWYLI